jgi:hypothetical protein
MFQKKGKKGPDNSTRASVEKEMAMPRITRSAKIAERRLDASRIPEQSSTTLPGTVDKIIPASHSTSHSERAQIAVKGADRLYRDLRIENILTDENGDDVKLKKGARVGVTITANEAERDP